MLKDILNNRKAKGIFVKECTFPAMVMLSQQSGMDFIFYDCEHGNINEEKLHDLMVLGNCNSFPSIVRVPQLSKKDISRMLDHGAQGIMVPMIETKQQAIQFVEWSKYPPIGKRSYSGGANTHYAPSGNHEINMKHMNETTLTIVQIESVKGVNNIDEILSVDGVDAVIIGPVDLGISMGILDNVMDEKILEMISKVVQACKKHNKYFGIIGKLSLLKYFKKDIDILVSAIDLNLLRSGLKQSVKEIEEIK